MHGKLRDLLRAGLRPSLADVVPAAAVGQRFCLMSLVDLHRAPSVEDRGWRNSRAGMRARAKLV
jgi:hypothetical protein